MSAIPTPPPNLAHPAFSLVVAMDEARGIGRDGDLAWRLPADMQWFRALTVGDGHQSVLMGRKTWESIPDRFRPLPGRANIVLSRSDQLALPEGVAHAPSLEAGLACAREHAGAAFVIGGGTIYAEALQHPACQRIYLTEVSGSFDCDTFLPEFSSDWGPSFELGSGEHEGIGYRFMQLDRA